MLLMSLVVTGLVQATQAVLRLRGRNLERGLVAILQRVRGSSAADARQDARVLLNAQDAPVVTPHEQPRGLLSATLGPELSWLEPKELERILESCPLHLDDGQKESIVERFKALDGALRKRFLRTIRFWTLVWSVVVAVHFQISVPALLSELSTNAQLRAQALQMVPAVLDEAREVQRQTARYEDVSTLALERLGEKHPDLQVMLEEAAGIGPGKANILDELGLVLAKHPRRATLLAEYERLLDDLYQDQLQAAFAVTDAAISRLAYFDIKPWKDGWEFYATDDGVQWRNLIGVLLTFILLSFGAPFWFDMLKRLANLRDTLKQEEKNKSGTDENGSSDNSGKDTAHKLNVDVARRE